LLKQVGDLTLDIQSRRVWRADQESSVEIAPGLSQTGWRTNTNT